MRAAYSAVTYSLSNNQHIPFVSITKFRSKCFQNTKLNHKGQRTIDNVFYVVNYTGSKKKKNKSNPRLSVKNSVVISL